MALAAVSAGSFPETAAGNGAHLLICSRKISHAMLIYLFIYLIIYLRPNNPLFTHDLVLSNRFSCGVVLTLKT